MRVQVGEGEGGDMKLLSVIVCSFFNVVPALAQYTYSYTYQDEKSRLSSFEIYDDPFQSGEEYGVWISPDFSSQLAKPKVVTPQSYEFNYFLQNPEGEILLDVDLAISKGVAFVQIKKLLLEESFRVAFDYLPKTCAEDDVAFLIITDNGNSTMKGFCLKLAKN